MSAYLRGWVWVWVWVWVRVLVWAWVRVWVDWWMGWCMGVCPREVVRCQRVFDLDKLKLTRARLNDHTIARTYASTYAHMRTCAHAQVNGGCVAAVCWQK